MGLFQSIVARFHPLLRRPCRFSANREERGFSSEVGKKGEQVAALWLRSRKARILRKNYRAEGGGEVDIVYRDGAFLVFCEVKTRTSTAYGPPSLAVNKQKRGYIRKGARSWLRALKRKVPYRYDIVEVVFEEGYPPKVNRIVHAFGDSEQDGQ